MDIERALGVHRDSISELLDAANAAGGSWEVPRAEGKWSPAQLVEHLARSLEEGAKVVAGEPSAFSDMPRIVRPLMRFMFFNRIVKGSRFPKAKTPAPFNPESGSESPAAAAERMAVALARFDEACLARAADGGEVVSGVFGSVSVEDYVLFNARHVRHHLGQLPTA